MDPVGIEVAPDPAPSIGGAPIGWPTRAPSGPVQLLTWMKIGLQSFGGGQTTQLLVYDTFVERKRWMGPGEFTEAWGLCQIPPGINLLALSALIGWRLAGPLGTVWALAGLLIPSVTVTVLFSAAYSWISGSHWTALGLRGVVAGVAGIGIFMTIRLIGPPLKASASEGRGSLFGSVMVLTVAALSYLLLHPPVVLMFAGAGTAMTLLGWARRRGRAKP